MGSSRALPGLWRSLMIKSFEKTLRSPMALLSAGLGDCMVSKFVVEV